MPKVQFVEEPGFSEADETAWTAIRASLSRDADKATDLGTAFHRLAQQAVCAHNEGAPLICPGKSHVDALARHCGLSDLQRIRLTEALARWFESDVAARVVTFSRLRAEVPFFVRVGRGVGAPFMEGEIDLLADGEDGRTALVVDYKTADRQGKRRSNCTKSIDFRRFATRMPCSCKAMNPRSSHSCAWNSPTIPKKASRSR